MSHFVPIELFKHVTWSENGFIQKYTILNTFQNIKMALHVTFDDS